MPPPTEGYRYTWVCIYCQAGWESNEEEPPLHHCGQVAQLRGSYVVVDLP